MRRLPAADSMPTRSARRRGATGAKAAAAVALAALACGTYVPAASAATYKWVDDKGVVHYTDKVPPEAVNRGNVELSKDGVPLRKVDPALTPEQRRAREQEEERKRQVAKQQEETARRDRALLASYASESEIDLAKARALNTIDAVLQSTTAYTEQLTKRRVELKAKMEGYKNRPVPPVIERELEGLDEELARQAEVVAAKRKEIAGVTARYDADKTRYRELTVGKTPGEIAASTGITQTSTHK